MIRRLAVLLVVLLTSFARGEARPTLPLLGNDRPAMSMPVTVQGATAQRVVDISGSGSLPDARRRQTLPIAVLFVIFATAVALWPTKHAALAMGALVAMTLIGIHAWTSRGPGAISTGAAVIVESLTIVGEVTHLPWTGGHICDPSSGDLV